MAVNEKKYPEWVQKYRERGTTVKKKVSMSEAEVWEYGFSKALMEFCPDGWKKPLGDDWKDVLSIIILNNSPRSYLQRENAIKKESDFRYRFASQTASLSQRIY